MDPLLTTQVKAVAGKASTAIPAGGVYANDIVPPHDPGSSRSANLLVRLLESVDVPKGTEGVANTN